MKWVHGYADFPPGVHVAALRFSSIFIPGDERSKTNPGHGYPERNEPVVEYITFESVGEAETWAGDQTPGTFRLMVVNPAQVRPPAKISVKWDFGG